MTGYPPAHAGCIDVAWDGGVRDHATDPALVLPDLSDPATLGCLLALVREAWSAPRALVRLSADGVRFHIFDVDRAGGINEGNWRGWLSEDYPSEAAALIAALEAAP